MSDQPVHPSDTIKDATSFPDALRRLRDAFQYEIDHFGDSSGTREKGMRGVQAAAAIVIAMMDGPDDEEGRVEALAVLRAVDLDTFADALETGNYGLLAF